MKCSFLCVLLDDDSELEDALDSLGNMEGKSRLMVAQTKIVESVQSELFQPLAESL